jgi:hypothetical protein
VYTWSIGIAKQDRLSATACLRPMLHVTRGNAGEKVPT